MKPDFVANVMFSILFGMLAIPFLAVGIRGLKDSAALPNFNEVAIFDDACLLRCAAPTVPLLFVFGTQSFSAMGATFVMCVQPFDVMLLDEGLHGIGRYIYAISSWTTGNARKTPVSVRRALLLKKDSIPYYWDGRYN